MKTSNLTPNLPAARASGLPGGLTPPLFNHISSPFAAHGVSPAQRWRRRILAPLVVAVTLSLSGLVARADVVYEPLREFGYGTVSALAISPNNQRLVSAGSRGVLLWDIESARVIRRLPASARGEPQPVFSPDGTLLLTGSEQSETAELWNVETGACLHRLAHGQTVWALAFLPDGQRVIGVHGNAVCLWDVASGQRLWTITHEDKLENFSLSADGRRLVTWKWWWTAGWGTAKVWDTETGQLIRTLCSGGLAPMSAAISPDGQQVATGHHVSTGGPNIRLWDVETGQLLRTIAAYDWSVNSLVFSPDGSRILSSGWNEDRARLWDAVTGRLLHEFGDGYVWSACFSSDGGRIITQGSAIRLWDADTGSLLTTCADEQEARAAVFSPDGKWLVVAGAEPVLWDAQTGTRVKSFAGHSDGAFDTIAFSADERQVVAKESGTITAWDLETGKLAAVLEAWPPVATPSEVSPDGRLKLTWGAPAPHTGDPIDARLVDVQTQLELRTLSGANSPKTFSSDGRTVLTATWEGVLRLWDIRDLVDWLEECGPPYSPPLVQPTRTLDVGYGSLRAFAVFPDGRWLLTGSTRGAFIWDIEAGELVRELQGLTNGVSAVAISADGRQVLAGGDCPDDTVTLWDAEHGRLLRSFDGLSRCEKLIAISPDGRWVFAAGSPDTPGNNAVFMWDTGSGQLLRTFVGHTNWIACLVLSPDGRRLLTGSASENGAMLWDTETGGLIETFLLSPSEGVRSLAFSHDGRFAAVGSLRYQPPVGAFQPATVQVWDVQTGLRRWAVTLPDVPANGGVDSVAFSPDDREVLAVSSDTYFLDTTTGQVLRSVHPKLPPGRVAFLDGRRIVSTGEGSVLVWDATTGNVIKTCIGHGGVNAVTISPDRKLVLAGGADSRATLWDAQTGEYVRDFKGHTTEVTAVAVSPNGGQVLTASADNTAKLWDTASGRLVRTFAGDTNRIGSIAFNVDGTEILVASDDGTIRFWEVSSGQARQVYDWGRGGGGSCAALSLDGHRLLSLLDGDARLWDLQTGQVQWTLEGWWLSGPAGFSPDGRTVAIGNRLIDAQAGHVLRELRWELYDPEWDLRMSVDGSCGGFSPDGQRLLTTHGLWDVASGQPTLLFDVLDGNALDVSAVATLSSDGLLAATGNRDGTVNLWDIGRLSARLRLVTSSQGLQVRWDKGTLQSAETVNGPWQDMTNAVSPFPADVVAGNKFYRVKVEE